MSLQWTSKLEMFLRAGAASFFTATYWICFLAFHLITAGRIPDSWVSGMVHFWGKAVLSILSIRLELLNVSTTSDRAGRVVIINHQSALDLAWAAAISPPNFLAIGKKELIYIPVINLVWWRLGLIRIDRHNHVKAMSALRGVAQEVAADRRSLMVAPEGTRTHDGKIAPFKKGAFRIAADAGVPICPIVVSGAYELLPRNRWIPRKGTIRVFFLPPFEVGPKQLGDGSVPEGSIEKVRKEMIECQQKIANAPI